MTHEELVAEILKNVVMGRVDRNDEGFEGNMEGQPGVSELVQEALEQKVPPDRILTEALSAAMTAVGEKYECKEYLIPDMLASAECVGAAMDILEPHLVGDSVQSKGTFVIATVEGDLHDIGKSIVGTMLKGAGYKVKDLGTDVKADAVIDAVRTNGATHVGLSALLTTTMVHMKSVVDLLAAGGLRDRVKVLIGGAPTSAQFAQEVGADAWCRDAFDAIEKLKAMSEA